MPVLSETGSLAVATARHGIRQCQDWTATLVLPLLTVQTPVHLHEICIHHLATLRGSNVEGELRLARGRGTNNDDDAGFGSRQRRHSSSVKSKTPVHREHRGSCSPLLVKPQTTRTS